MSRAKPIRDVLRGANERVVPLLGDPALTGTRRAHDEIIRAGLPPPITRRAVF